MKKIQKSQIFVSMNKKNKAIQVRLKENQCIENTIARFSRLLCVKTEKTKLKFREQKLIQIISNKHYKKLLINHIKAEKAPEERVSTVKGVIIINILNRLRINRFRSAN